VKLQEIHKNTKCSTWRYRKSIKRSYLMGSLSSERSKNANI